MKIYIFLSGVADIRYPLHDICLGSSGELLEAGQVRRILSPYDEAALELALKLRDADPATFLSVYLISGANDDAVLRTIAAHKPDHLEAVQLTPCCPWDAQLTAAQFASAFENPGTEDYQVLVGREFGDADPGNFPAALAVKLGLPLLARVQFLEHDNRGGVTTMRERGTHEEWTWISQPAVLSITNDKRNKLRHPLMKNVIMAKRMSFSSRLAPYTAKTSTVLGELRRAEPASRAVECQQVTGSASEQAAQLATIIRKHLG